MFSTSTCLWCRKVKDYLKEKKVKFREVDVARDKKAARDMVRKSGQQGVPQIWINNYPIVGFDKTKIDRMLKIK
ncbi:MAG: glutathione S-transferase N-terminal domain-containing protein [Armatimonadetes bacterium]|nr:glutathione S-transferase N-terminal domain-containing protein [Armatimonadota bacterium]